MIVIGRLKDLTGQTFGRLTVIERGENSNTNKARWWCKCNCGNPELVLVVSSQLLSNKTVSCGCVRLENLKAKCKKYNEFDLNNEDFVIIKASNTKEDILVSKTDYELIEDIRVSCWSVCNGYAETKVNGKTVRLHRLVTKALKGQVVDHINHNTLDNRKENLRIVTVTENSRNHKIKNNNTSGVTGVRWHKRDCMWEAFIVVDNKQKHLGSFDNKEDAINARKLAEDKYFGEYSYDNSMKLQTNIIKDKQIKTE